MPLVLAVTAAAWLGCGAPRSLQLTLRFHPFLGEEALQLDELRYENPGGAGSFKVRDFQFFVSNIRLVSDGSEFVEPESYHLARFDSEQGVYELVLENLPPADYRRIEFGIGVDEEANGSLETIGDLDPNGRMAWSWEVGYKFVLVEGGLVLGDGQLPLVYHVGFSENYKQVSIDLPEGSTAGQDAVIPFRADLLRMFDGLQTVDMAALPSVKFDRADAKLLADNYADMISLCASGCGH